MAGLPITVFASRVDPDAVLALVLDHCPSAKVSRDDSGFWRQILVEISGGWFRRKQTLKLSHDPDHYQGAGWSKQHHGMLNYFANFPIEGERRERVTATIKSLSFALGTIAKPGLLSSDKPDPRFELICRIAREIDGCLFAPGVLLDYNGRVLIEADGTFDADAQFPESGAAAGTHEKS